MSDLIDAHVTHHGNLMNNATKVQIAGMNGGGSNGQAQ
jgi:hypothetical protein